MHSVKLFKFWNKHTEGKKINNKTNDLGNERAELLRKVRQLSQRHCR